MDATPLNFSFDAALDSALTRGWSSWIETARKKGVERTTEWLQRRDEPGLDPADLAVLIEGVLQDDSPIDRAMAAAELAEYSQVEDDALAATLWEGVLVSGREANDSEVYFEGLSQLAEIELEYGDPQSAAALYIDFLNWVRESGHSVDAESILASFDQIVELATGDGAAAAAASWSHRQSRFFRSIDGDETRIVDVDWEAPGTVYVVWED